jgi:hypothetical protein
MSLSDNCEGGESSKEKQGDEHKPEPEPSFTEWHTAYTTVKSFFYIHSIRKYDKNNIKVVLFNVKHKVSTK